MTMGVYTGRHSDRHVSVDRRPALTPLDASLHDVQFNNGKRRMALLHTRLLQLIDKPLNVSSPSA
jgi:hypothetical protein